MDATQVHAHNTSVILHLAWEAGEISRANLARESGLAPSTISAIVAELLDMELLSESHIARSNGGRPPIVLRFDDDRFQILGVDLGATHVSVALTNLRGRTLAWRSRDHAVRADPQGTLALVVDLVREVLAGVGADLGRVVGLGLGVPSPVEIDDPDHLSELILPAWNGVRPGEWLASRLDLPVFLENDANLCALAEAWHGAGRGLDTLAYIKVGTGVGAGLVVGGEVFRGAHGFAGEIGHTAIDSSGPPCACGLRGCLQAMVGSQAIVERIQQSLDAAPSSLLTGLEPLTLVAVSRAAHAGDPLAVEAVAEAGRYLGIAVANLFNLVNPSRVLLGGGLTAAGDLLLEPLRAALRERALWASIAQADVRLGELGDRAAALGAATLVLRAAMADPVMFTTRLRAHGARPHSQPRPAQTQETP